MFLYKCWRERSVRGEIRVGEITDPLYLPLKRGGQVCPPFECLDELLTISARSQTASPPSGETGERYEK